MKTKFVLALFFVFFTFTFLGRNLNEIAYGVALCDIDQKAESIDISSPPYVIAVDKGHGGVDTGAQHIVDEIDVKTKILPLFLQGIKQVTLTAGKDAGWQNRPGQAF